MFNEKIETIVYNRVATIHGKIAFQKVLAQLSDTGMMMIYSNKQKELNSVL